MAVGLDRGAIPGCWLPVPGLRFSPPRSCCKAAAGRGQCAELVSLKPFSIPARGRRQHSRLGVCRRGRHIRGLSSFPQCAIIPVSTGESSTVVSPYLPGGVSDGQWHTLQLRYYNKVRVPQLSPCARGSLSARGVSERLWLSCFLALPHGGGCGEKVEVVFSPWGWVQWSRQLGARGDWPSGPCLEPAGMRSMQCPCLCPSLALFAGLGWRCPSCFAHTSSSAVVPGPCSGLFLAVV